MADSDVERWKHEAAISLNAAKLLYQNQHFRACANRAYYSAYQATTSFCIAHGDATQFPPGWNNPSHEQLPGLIVNNGSISRSARQVIAARLRFLRYAREDADYRPGHTVDATTARDCLRASESVFANLRIEDD